MVSSFSDFLDMIYGLLQGFRPFLFEYSSECTNFADDITPYECDKRYDDVVNKLETTVGKLFNWSYSSHLKANASVFFLFFTILTSGNN